MIPPALPPPAATWSLTRERRNRIRVAVAAYAYEFTDTPIMSDAEYDRLARRIQPTRSTGHALLDRFFRDHYSPDTGMWVRWHPGLTRLAAIHERYWAAGVR